MNDPGEKSYESYRSLLLLSEINGEEPLSQRELSKCLGIAVGLVNSYLKNLVSKGYVRVKNFPSNRCAYLLTPQGMAEKSRLDYQHLLVDAEREGRWERNLPGSSVTRSISMQ